MNTNRALRSLLLLTAVVFSPAAGNASESALEPVRVFLVDDQTGEELRTKHGIEALQVEDLVVLINPVLMGHTPIHLYHQPIDEDASDNPVSQMVFKPFTAEPPPARPSPSMPLGEFVRAAAEYKTARAKWQTSILAYQREAVSGAQAFVKSVTATQLEVAQRFDQILKKRNGRDFNRSDICGTLEIANRLLGKTGRRVLILNTDAEDLPAHRRPRRTPLNESELDAGIDLIFVNTSRVPDQSILFAGLKNRTRHADSVKEAMGMVVKMLTEEGRNPPNEPAAAPTPASVVVPQRFPNHAAILLNGQSDVSCKAH